MALMPNSVSPKRRENTVGPKPTKNCGTRMPNFRAQKKCPNSWKPMLNSSPTAKATIPRTVRRNPLSSASGDGSAGVFPGPLLSGQHVFHAGGCAEVRRGVQGTRDHLHDRCELQLACCEGGDRLLVGRVEHRRDDTAGLAGLAGQPHRRE